MKSQEPTRTILFDTHIALNAKMMPFGGFAMPLQYDGIIVEHSATREAVGIFDTCHMGEFRISGATALKDLEYILTCPIESMRIGQCRYGFICNEQGGVIDDQILYRLADDTFYMVVNAGTQQNDLAWIKEQVSDRTVVEDLSSQTAKIDVQGPKAPKLLEKLLDEPIDDLKFYTFKENRFNGVDIISSRTGYTGEIGLEIYCPNDIAADFWSACVEMGAKPAGLGCRDTLRLEMGFPLYGHELDTVRNPAETGFTRSIAEDKEYIGSTVVLDPMRTKSRLAGITMEGRRAARHGDRILSEDGREIGVITSGSFSPSLKTAIALGYVNKEYSDLETELLVDNGRQQLRATVKKLPFYKEATCRKAIAKFL